MNQLDSDDWADVVEPPIRYAICDVRGRLQATLVRHPDKRFAWYDAAGRLGLGGIGVCSLPLYGSELLRRIPNDTMVLVVEGAKAAEALRRCAIPALATITGAAATPSRAVLEVLRGRPVTLWPDHDCVGREHMRRIGELLVDIAAEVWWIEPDSRLPIGGDAADVQPDELARHFVRAVKFGANPRASRVSST